jgi:hypothetical protein
MRAEGRDGGRREPVITEKDLVNTDKDPVISERDPIISAKVCECVCIIAKSDDWIPVSDDWILVSVTARSGGGVAWQSGRTEAMSGQRGGRPKMRE